MNIRNVLAASLLGIATATAAGGALARTDVDFSINVGPPAPVYESVPPPRAGYVWAPGYWGWNGHRHAWHRGYWVHERRGYVWAPNHWEHRGDRWYMRGGHWERHYG